MRLAIRALLLVIGCAVMVATAPTPDGSFSVTLPAGGAETVEVSVTGDGGKQQVRPQYHVHSGRPRGTADGVRLVGLASPTHPAPEAYATLDPTATFTVGQQVEGLGTVIFVQDVPDDGSNNTELFQLPEYASVFLTLYAPDEIVSASLELAKAEMAEQCHCELDEPRFDHVRTYNPPTPDAGTDAGTGGRDGG